MYEPTKANLLYVKDIAPFIANGNPDSARNAYQKLSSLGVPLEEKVILFSVAEKGFDRKSLIKEGFRLDCPLSYQVIEYISNGYDRAMSEGPVGIHEFYRDILYKIKLTEPFVPFDDYTRFQLIDNFIDRIPKNERLAEDLVKFQEASGRENSTFLAESFTKEMNNLVMGMWSLVNSYSYLRQMPQVKGASLKDIIEEYKTWLSSRVKINKTYVPVNPIEYNSLLAFPTVYCESPDNPSETINNEHDPDFIIALRDAAFKFTEIDTQISGTRLFIADTFVRELIPEINVVYDIKVLNEEIELDDIEF